MQLEGEGRVRRCAGFTLVEVMVFMAFMAVVAAGALPNCKDYVLNGRFVDGADGRAAMRADMERLHQANAGLASSLLPRLPSLPRLPDWHELPGVN